MQPLTQQIFKGRPNWVKSAAINLDGQIVGFSCRSSDLRPTGRRNSWMPVEGIKYQTLYLGMGGYTANWHELAIDREDE